MEGHSEKEPEQQQQPPPPPPPEQQTSPVENNTAEAVVSLPVIRPEIDYLKTIPAILKIVQIVLDIIVFICIGCSSFYFKYSHNAGFVNFVVGLTFIFTILFFVFYLVNLIHYLPGPWVLIEAIVVGVFAVLSLIALIVAACEAKYAAAIASIVFLAFVTVAYAAELVLIVLQIRSTGTTHTKYVATATTQPIEEATA